MFSRVHALGVDAMNRQHELHIKKLSADHLLPIIQQSEFAELADLIEQYNISGEELLVLKEYDFLLKYGCTVNRRLVTRLLDSIQNRPQELFPLKPTVKPKPFFAGGSKPSLNRTQSVRLVTAELAKKFSLGQTSESEVSMGNVVSPIPTLTRPLPPPRPLRTQTIDDICKSVQLDENTSKETDREPLNVDDLNDYFIDDKTVEPTAKLSGGKVKPPAILPKPRIDQQTATSLPANVDQLNLERDERVDILQHHLFLTEGHLQSSDYRLADHNDQHGETGSLLKRNELHSAQKPSNTALEDVGKVEVPLLDITSNPTDQANRINLDDIMNEFNDVLELINFSKAVEPFPASATTCSNEKEATPSNRDLAHKEPTPSTIVNNTKLNDFGDADAKYFDKAHPRKIVDEPIPFDHTATCVPLDALVDEVDYVRLISPQCLLRENKFYRDCDQATCRNMLANKPPGTFLIRPSGNYVCVLVIRGQDRIKNVPMQYDYNERKFYLVAVRGQVNYVRFATLDDLVEYYMENEVDGDLLLKPQFNILDVFGNNSHASTMRNCCHAMATSASTGKPLDSPVSMRERKSDEYEPAPVLRPRIGNNAPSREYSQLPPVSPRQAAPLELDRDHYDSNLYLAPIQTNEDGLSLVMRHEAFRPLDRAGAKDLLRHTKRGTYLLRRSGEEQFLAILVINGGLKVQNVPILYNKSSAEFYLDTSACLEKQTFKCIDKLLKYYCVNAINGDKLAVDNRNHLPSCEGQEQKTI